MRRCEATGAAVTGNIVLMALSLLLAGCGNPTSPADVAASEGRLLVGNAVEPVSLDPHLTTGVSENNIHFALYEGLVTPHPRTLDPQPGVALSWERSEDQLVYTFALRDDARWSDGRLVTAPDFVFSWKRILHPDLAAPNRGLLDVVAGAEAFSNGTGSWEDVGITALDDHTLRVTLERPTPYFLLLLMHPAWMPVPRHVVEAAGAPFARGNPWTDPATHVGNGPFHLVSWQPNEKIVVEAHPGYWNAGEVSLRAVEFHPIEDASGEERAFLGGQLHVTETLPAGRAPIYRRNDDPRLRADPYLGTYFFWLNVAVPPFDDRRVRRALSLAVDREEIVRYITAGGQPPARHLTPPGLPGYVRPEPIASDPVEARRLLAEAGFPGGEGFPRMDLLYNTSSNNRAIAEAVQAMWNEELGIRIDLLNQEWKTYLSSRAEKRFPIVRASWIGDYPDALTFLEILEPDSPHNHSGWQDDRFVEQLREAALAGSPEERMRQLREAEALVLEELPVIPIYHFVTNYLIDSRVRGWEPNLLDWHPYQHVRLSSP